jgi:hypothetical protein
MLLFDAASCCRFVCILFFLKYFFYFFSQIYLFLDIVHYMTMLMMPDDHEVETLHNDVLFLLLLQWSVTTASQRELILGWWIKCWLIEIHCMGWRWWWKILFLHTILIFLSSSRGNIFRNIFILLFSLTLDNNKKYMRIYVTINNIKLEFTCERRSLSFHFRCNLLFL